MQMRFKRFNDIREDSDISVKEISKILNINVDNYYDYANGRSNIPLEILNRYVNFFNVSFDYITGLSDIKKGYPGKIDIKKLKHRLKQIRKENGLSQNQIAYYAGDKQSTYWNYESGKSTIPISKLYLLAKYYNISIDYFVGKTDNKKLKQKTVT